MLLDKRPLRLTRVLIAGLLLLAAGVSVAAPESAPIPFSLLPQDLSGVKTVHVIVDGFSLSGLVSAAALAKHAELARLPVRFHALSGGAYQLQAASQRWGGGDPDLPRFGPGDLVVVLGGPVSPARIEEFRRAGAQVRTLRTLETDLVHNGKALADRSFEDAETRIDPTRSLVEQVYDLLHPNAEQPPIVALAAARERYAFSDEEERALVEAVTERLVARFAKTLVSRERNGQDARQRAWAELREELRELYRALKETEGREALIIKGREVLARKMQVVENLLTPSAPAAVAAPGQEQLPLDAPGEAGSAKLRRRQSRQKKNGRGPFRYLRLDLPGGDHVVVPTVFTGEGSLISLLQAELARRAEGTDHPVVGVGLRPAKGRANLYLVPRRGGDIDLVPLALAYNGKVGSARGGRGHVELRVVPPAELRRVPRIRQATQPRRWGEAPAGR